MGRDYKESYKSIKRTFITVLSILYVKYFQLKEPITAAAQCDVTTGNK